MWLSGPCGLIPTPILPTLCPNVNLGGSCKLPRSLSVNAENEGRPRQRRAEKPVSACLQEKLKTRERAPPVICGEESQHRSGMWKSAATRRGNTSGSLTSSRAERHYTGGKPRKLFCTQAQLQQNFNFPFHKPHNLNAFAHTHLTGLLGQRRSWWYVV